jgi:hypothetical protein
LDRLIGTRTRADETSNRRALYKLFLNSSPARAHDLSRGSLADNPDRGQSFGKPFARMPGQGRLRGQHQPPHDGLSQAGCSNVDDALRSSMRRCTPSGGIILPTSRQGRLRASRLDANGDRTDQVQQEGIGLSVSGRQSSRAIEALTGYQHRVHDDGEFPCHRDRRPLEAKLSLSRSPQARRPHSAWVRVSITVAASYSRPRTWASPRREMWPS